jgi:hypothetical protein
MKSQSDSLWFHPSANDGQCGTIYYVNFEAKGAGHFICQWSFNETGTGIIENIVSVILNENVQFDKTAETLV